MSKTRSVIEIIPSDSSYAENYLQLINRQLALRQAIEVGIADADAGKLTCLTTVKAKWFSR
jgi:predicted transcriptional regulator